MVVLPFSLTPFLIDSVALASLNSDWTFASVRSLAFRVFPIFVSALPSLPWHWTQLASQFAFASAANNDVDDARRTLAARDRIIFILDLSTPITSLVSLYN